MSTTADSAFQKQQIKIDLAIGPNPSWTNKHFVCACGAEFQFGCADELEPVHGATDAYYTPPCWSCERVGILTISASPAEPQPIGGA